MNIIGYVIAASICSLLLIKAWNTGARFRLFVAVLVSLIAGYFTMVYPSDGSVKINTEVTTKSSSVKTSCSTNSTGGVSSRKYSYYRRPQAMGIVIIAPNAGIKKQMAMKLAESIQQNMVVKHIQTMAGAYAFDKQVLDSILQVSIRSFKLKPHGKGTVAICHGEMIMSVLHDNLNNDCHGNDWAVTTPLAHKSVEQEFTIRSEFDGDVKAPVIFINEIVKKLSLELKKEFDAYEEKSQAFFTAPSETNLTRSNNSKCDLPFKMSADTKVLLAIMQNERFDRQLCYALIGVKNKNRKEMGDYFKSMFPNDAWKPIWTNVPPKTSGYIDEWIKERDNHPDRIQLRLARKGKLSNLTLAAKGVPTGEALSINNAGFNLDSVDLDQKMDWFIEVKEELSSDDSLQNLVKQAANELMESRDRIEVASAFAICNFSNDKLKRIPESLLQLAELAVKRFPKDYKMPGVIVEYLEQLPNPLKKKYLMLALNRLPDEARMFKRRLQLQRDIKDLSIPKAVKHD